MRRNHHALFRIGDHVLYRIGQIDDAHAQIARLECLQRHSKKTWRRIWAGLIFCDGRIFDVDRTIDCRNTLAQLGHEVLLVDLYLLYSSLYAVNQALDSVQ